MKDGLTLKHIFGNQAKPKQLIVVFHGLKTDGGAMLPAVSTLLSGMRPYKNLQAPHPTRQPVVLVPEAPYKMAVRKEDIHTIRKHYPSFTENKSRAWFKIKGNQLMKLITLKLAIMRANRFIDKQLKKYGLSDKDLVLMGYSQGGMMALYTGLSRKKPCAAVISHSGFYLGDQGGLFPARSKPPVMAVMGADDGLFNNPESRFPQHKDSVAKLRDLGIEVTNLLVPGLGHDYNFASVNAVSSFINAKLDRDPSPRLSSVFKRGGDHTLHMYAKIPDNPFRDLFLGGELAYEMQDGRTIRQKITEAQPLPRRLQTADMRLKRVILNAPQPNPKTA